MIEQILFRLSGSIITILAIMIYVGLLYLIIRLVAYNKTLNKERKKKILKFLIVLFNISCSFGMGYAFVLITLPFIVKP